MSAQGLRADYTQNTMLKSRQQSDAPLADQVAFWNDWNASTREVSLGRVSVDQAETVTTWLRRLGRNDLDIIDVGCGAGWLCERMTQFGRVTGTDLADSVLKRAGERLPEVRFVAGDFMTLDFGAQAYDVAVSLEVLSSVADQPAFLAKIASLLKPRGYLMLSTPNRLQLERNDIPPPGQGQIRQWVDRRELKTLLSRDFNVEELFSITPQFNYGPLRYVNSDRLHHGLSSKGLRSVSRALIRCQERAWLGWTLMALARKRA
jgi:2-polyprenyl-3-methyl-5-hydroxy-6-metoxy-1,4-benzoquinol methylase